MDTQYFEALRRENPFRKTREAVYAFLRQSIIDEAFPLDRKINASAVAEALGVSRTPVREALEQLHEEGLVLARKEHSGFFPVTITRNQIEDLFFARRIVEGNAAFLCATHREAVDFSQLKQLGEDFRNCFRTGNFSGFDDIDHNFHRLLIVSCQNIYFQGMYDSMNDSIDLMESKMRRILMGKTLSGQMESFALQHLNIVHAIEMGIPNLALQASNSHIDSCIDYIRRFYSEY